MKDLSYIEFLLFFGLALLTASILFKRLETSFLSLPIVLLLLGIGLGLLFPEFYDIYPQDQRKTTEHITEFAVVVSLTGAGLKLDRDIGFRSWRITWRLLAIAMPLCLIALVLGGYYWMGLSFASSILLGAVLIPTDPVLASSVQVGPPGEEKEGSVRFGLTSEAGLNDSLAFPFVHLAILIGAAQQDSSEVQNLWQHWLLFYVLWKIAGAIIIGMLVGRIIAFLYFKFGRGGAIGDSLVVISLTLLSYSIAEVAHTYGFLAVFICAYMYRRFEKENEKHVELHDFSEQMERLFISFLLVFFGILITQDFLAHISRVGLLIGLIFILVIRPLFGYISLSKLPIHPLKKGAISFLGIRGIGSFYYLAYAFNHTGFFTEMEMKELWSTVGFIVLLSIVIHGITSPLIMSKVEKRNNTD